MPAISRAGVFSDTLLAEKLHRPISLTASLVTAPLARLPAWEYSGVIRNTRHRKYLREVRQQPESIYLVARVSELRSDDRTLADLPILNKRLIPTTTERVLELIYEEP
jgi:hypothetical protein